MASAVPAALLRATVRAARHIGLGESAAVAAVSSTTIVLMKQAARTMMIARLKAIAAAALIVVTLAGLATGLAATGIGRCLTALGIARLANGNPASRAVAGQAKVGERETIAFRGRVLAPDGKPAAGAGVYTVAPRPGDDSGRAGPQGEGRRGRHIPLRHHQGCVRHRNRRRGFLVDDHRPGRRPTASAPTGSSCQGRPTRT